MIRSVPEQVGTWVESRGTYGFGNNSADLINEWRNYGVRTKAGDIVQMELDTFNNSDFESFGKKPHLKFYKNEHFLGDAYNNIEVGPGVQYQLVICLGGRDTSITLQRFEENIHEFEHGLDWLNEDSLACQFEGLFV